MISVIVPVYNVEEFLPHCLDSLSEQTYSGPMEVILINDGSSDASPAICENYRQHHSNVILIHQENKGLSEARNSGIRAATGDWIFFLDADDWLAPEALQTLLDYAKIKACDMVIGSFYYTYDTYLLFDNRWFKNQNAFVLTRDEAMKDLIQQKFFKNFAWGKLYRTAHIKKHPFKPGAYFEDRYWQHLMVDESRAVGVVPKPLYYYRQRIDSLSGSFSKNNLDLLKGYEERLVFIRHKYPQLMDCMAQQFWKLCHDFFLLAQHNNPHQSNLFRLYFLQVKIEYNDVFEKSLKRYLPYQITQHVPILYPAYHFLNKVLTFLFCKKPTRIPL